MIIQNKRLVYLISGALALLLIPFTAMQFTNEVDWDGRDFLIMGVLLTVTACSVEFVLRSNADLIKRLIFVALVLLGFLLVWAELAVGIFGTPFAGS